jgi:hypothetical protein
MPGARILAPEVTHVSEYGLCLLMDGRERFLDFNRFPWFREAPVRAVFNVRRPSHDHLRWPDLDVDLELDSLDHPERYPLVSRVLSATVSECPPRPGVAAAKAVRRATAKTPRASRPKR